MDREGIPDQHSTAGLRVGFRPVPLVLAKPSSLSSSYQRIHLETVPSWTWRVRATFFWVSPWSTLPTASRRISSKVRGSRLRASRGSVTFLKQYKRAGHQKVHPNYATLSTHAHRKDRNYPQSAHRDT